MIQRGCIYYIIFDYLSVLMQSPYTPKDTHYGIGWKHFMYKMSKNKKLRDENVATLGCISVCMSL